MQEFSASISSTTAELFNCRRSRAVAFRTFLVIAGLFFYVFGGVTVPRSQSLNLKPEVEDLVLKS